MSRGGPSKLTPEVEKEILECVASGMPQAHVCEMLGFTQDALRAHCKRHPEFSTLYKEAQVKCTRFMLNQINVGARGWQGPAWLLSKKYPHVYGKKVDEAAPVIQPVTIVLETKKDSRASDPVTNPATQ